MLGGLGLGACASRSTIHNAYAPPRPHDNEREACGLEPASHAINSLARGLAEASRPCLDIRRVYITSIYIARCTATGQGKQPTWTQQPSQLRAAGRLPRISGHEQPAQGVHNGTNGAQADNGTRNKALCETGSRTADGADGADGADSADGAGLV